MAVASAFKFMRLQRRIIDNRGERIIANVWQDRNNQDFIDLTLKMYGVTGL